MSEKLSGIVAEAESYMSTIEPPVSGVILRPVETWYEPIVIGKDVKLVLSNGDCYQTRATGFELGGKLNAGLLVNEIPGVSNEDLLGAKLYVLVN
jgi:hypothetical protein